MTDPPLGLEIRLRREQSRLSQRELPQRVHISRGYVCHIEKGRTTPSRTVCEEIARVLSMPIDDLLARAGHTAPGEAMRLDTDEVALVRLYRAVPPVARRVVLGGLRAAADIAAVDEHPIQT